MDKPALIRALCDMLEAEIARATEAAERTIQGATHEEARAENDKDTRALEQTYLARGQAQRVVDLQDWLKQIRFMGVRTFGADDAIAMSALVELEDDGKTRWYFLAPAAGGRTVQLGAATVDILTPQAPLGKALAGRFLDDEFTFKAGGKAKELIITRVL